MQLLPHDEVPIIDHTTRVLGLVELEQLEQLLETQKQQEQEREFAGILQV